MTSTLYERRLDLNAYVFLSIQESKEYLTGSKWLHLLVLLDK